MEKKGSTEVVQVVKGEDRLLCPRSEGENRAGERNLLVR